MFNKSKDDKTLNKKVSIEIRKNNPTPNNKVKPLRNNCRV